MSLGFTSLRAQRGNLLRLPQWLCSLAMTFLLLTGCATTQTQDEARLQPASGSEIEPLNMQISVFYKDKNGHVSRAAEVIEEKMQAQMNQCFDTLALGVSQYSMLDFGESGELNAKIDEKIHDKCKNMRGYEKDIRDSQGRELTADDKVKINEYTKTSKFAVDTVIALQDNKQSSARLKEYMTSWLEAKTFAGVGSGETAAETTGDKE